MLSMLACISCRRPGNTQEFENTGVSTFEEGEFGKQNLISVAKAAGSFEKLALAIKTAGLKEEFMQEGPYTLFAPTDEAFELLPGKSFNELLEPDHKHLLVELLLYHLVSGVLPADSLAEGMKLTTEEGDIIEVDSAQQGWMINDAHLVKADIQARNGVVHIIDKVLMPPGN